MTKTSEPPMLGKAGDETHGTAKTLPGEDSIDAALLDEAVLHIQETYLRKEVEAVIEVGRFLFERFFMADEEQAQQRYRQHGTFVQLAETVGKSTTWLWRAIQLHLQVEHLPESTRSLPYSHQVALLTVSENADKRELAHMAIKKGLTKRQLEERVREWKDAQPKSGRGNKSLPEAVRVIRRVIRAVGTPSASLDPQVFHRKGLSPSKVREMITDLDEKLEMVAALKQQLELGLAQFETAEGSRTEQTRK